MNRKKQRKKQSAALCLAVILCLTALTGLFSVSADETETAAGDNTAPVQLTGIDPGLLVGGMSHTVDLFGSADVSAWQTVYETTRLSAETVLPWDMKQVFEGTRSLVLSTDSYSTYGGMSAIRNYTKAEDGTKNYLDFSRDTYLVLAVAAPAGRNYTLTLTLLSTMISTSTQGNLLNYSESVTFAGGEWITLLFDISAFEGRSEVQRVTLNLTADGAEYGTQIMAAVDAIGASSDENLVRSLRFLSSSYRAENCTVTAGDVMTVTCAGVDSAVIAENLHGFSVSGQNALRLRFTHNTTCRAVSLFYTPEGGTEVLSATAEIASSAGVQYCYFPLRAKDISAIRIVFNGDLTGDISILGIEPAAYFVSSVDAIGSIVSCVINDAKNAVTITGTLDTGTVDKYRSGTLNLYELEMYEDESRIAGGTGKVIAESALGASFSFSVPLSGGDRSCLTKKYAVAVSYKDSILPVDTAKYVTNPEILSASSLTYPDITNKKGTDDAASRDVLDGVRNTCIEVRAEKLVSIKNTGFSRETDGVKYDFHEDYLLSLDEEILKATALGINVTLILTVSPTSDAALNRILLYPGTDLTAAYGAFNTATSDGIRYLRAVCELLASRYGTNNAQHGTVIGYAVGKNVENAPENYNMGAQRPESFVSAYANAVRIVYNSVKSVSAAAHISVSLGCRWNAGMTRFESYHYDARTILDILGAKMQAEGGISWALCYDPFPQDADYYAYADTNADMTPDAPYVTLANLEVATAYLQKRLLTPGSAVRPVLLVEQFDSVSGETDEKAQIRRSADYAYAYYKLTMKAYSMVEALILKRSADYNGTLRYIDTEASSDATAYALQVIGISDWKEKIPAFDISRAVTRSLTETSLMTSIPDGILGEMSFLTFDGSGKNAAWNAEENCGDPGMGTVVSGHGSVLTVNLTGGGGEAGTHTVRALFTQAFDLSVCPYLRMEVLVSALPEGTEKCTLSVIGGSGDSYAVVAGEVNAGAWTTVYVSLADFSGKKSCDSLRLRLTDNGGNNLGGALLTVGAVSLLSTEYDSAALLEAFRSAQNAGTADQGTLPADHTRMILILLLVILVAGTAEVFHILSRRRRMKTAGEIRR